MWARGLKKYLSLLTVLLLNPHHPLTIGADPGRTVAQSPLIFLKTLRADLKTARTVPAEWFLQLTTMTAILAKPSAPVAFCFLFHFYRSASSEESQV